MGKCKKKVREIESDDGILIFNDTVQEKPYATENALISWHFRSYRWPFR